MNIKDILKPVDKKILEDRMKDISFDNFCYLVYYMSKSNKSNIKLAFFRLRFTWFKSHSIFRNIIRFLYSTSYLNLFGTLTLIYNIIISILFGNSSFFNPLSFIYYIPIIVFTCNMEIYYFVRLIAKKWENKEYGDSLFR